MSGLGIMISIGKWGGVYIFHGWSWRLCLGWIAISILPRDGDYILELAARGSTPQKNMSTFQKELSQ